jgi:hypothetical protein
MNAHLIILAVAGGTHGPVAEHLSTAGGHLSAARSSAPMFPAWLGWVLPVAAPASVVALLFCALCSERWLVAQSDVRSGDEEDHSQPGQPFTARPVAVDLLDGSGQPEREVRDIEPLVAQR